MNQKLTSTISKVELNIIAQNLNDTIKKQNNYVYEMLSEEGKRMYMPKGVLSQSAEAKEKKVKYNATIGMATENGKPMNLESINKYFSDMSPAEIFTYAPSTGIKELREEWKKALFTKNPSLKNKELSLPITTIGLTHGITICTSLFINEGDTVLAPDKMWGNYRLIIKERKKADLQQYKLFNDDYKLDVDGMRNKFTSLAKEKDKLIIVMNFPNNPTGYCPTIDEAKQLISIIKDLPNYDCNIIVIFDDAYFGLFYEDNAYKQSLFAELSCCSERILAIKCDASTKEEYVWGFRVGFITYGIIAENQKELYSALESKTAGVIRGTVSSPPHPLQEIILKALRSPNYEKEKKQKSEIKTNRYFEVKKVAYNSKYNDEWDVYPFNSGYFMCLKLKNVEAEALRIHLLNNYSLGIISTSQTDVRIAFSCLEKEQIGEVFELIYSGIKDLRA